LQPFAGAQNFSTPVRVDDVHYRADHLAYVEANDEVA